MLQAILDAAGKQPLLATTVTLTAILAIFTGYAAWSAHEAAKATRDGVQAELFVQIMTEYASSDMAAALRFLRPVDEAWLERSLSQWATKAAAGVRHTHDLNDSRRRVSHFFEKVALIVEEGLLEGALAEAVVDLAGRRLLLRAVLPLNRALAREIETQEKNEKTEQLLRKVFDPDYAEPKRAALPCPRHGED